jgi:hypothetical protein
MRVRQFSHYVPPWRAQPREEHQFTRAAPTLLVWSGHSCPLPLTLLLTLIGICSRTHEPTQYRGSRASAPRKAHKLRNAASAAEVRARRVLCHPDRSRSASDGAAEGPAVLSHTPMESRGPRGPGRARVHSCRINPQPGTRLQPLRRTPRKTPSVIPTGAGAPATAQWRDLLFCSSSPQLARIPKRDATVDPTRPKPEVGAPAARRVNECNGLITTAILLKISIIRCTLCT